MTNWIWLVSFYPSAAIPVSLTIWGSCRNYAVVQFTPPMLASIDKWTFFL